MRALLLIAVAACGGSQPAPSPAPARVSLVAPAEGSDDIVVAQVNGRPVWGSCVAHQGGGRAGLDQCVDFELLAQAAEQRGLAADKDVARALETALANRLVETKFEDRYQKPSDLGATIDKVVDGNLRQLHRPEYRSSVYVRVAFNPKTTSDAKVAEAKALAEQIAAKTRGEHGFLAAHASALADEFRKQAIDAGFTLDFADAGSHAEGGLVKPYAEALWAIPAIGDATPEPVRTPWGWDVIIWTDGTPPMDSTREALAAEVFPSLRRAYFDAWEKAIEKALGVHVEYVEANMGKLDALPVVGIQ